jgi:hypothetical protein
MVIEVHSREKKLVDKEIKMMDRFYKMFPEAASNTIVVVNNMNSSADEIENTKIL